MLRRFLIAQGWRDDCHRRHWCVFHSAESDVVGELADCAAVRLVSDVGVHRTGLVQAREKTRNADHRVVHLSLSVDYRIEDNNVVILKSGYYGLF